MPHEFNGNTAYVTIPPRYVERMFVLAPHALQRLHAFGLADRREAAWALVVAGATPLAGQLLLGWTFAEAIVCLVLNLLLGLLDDGWKILRAKGASGELHRHCAQDQFVWPIAHAQSIGKRIIHGKMLPTLEDLDEGRSQAAPFPFIFLAFVSAGFSGWLVHADAQLDVDAARVATGTVPSLLLFGIASFVHGTKRHPEWREAGSVRIATTTASAMLTFFAGMGLMMFVIAGQQHPTAPANGAILACAAAVGFGLWRLLQVERLKLAAHWLERGLEGRERAATERAAQRGNAREGKPAKR